MGYYLRMNWTTAALADVLRRRGIPNPVGVAAGGRPNKFGARKKILDGHTFDSTAEARRYLELKAMEAAGEIFNLQLQPVFLLQEKQPGIRAITYRGDFAYQDKEGKLVVEDVKGVSTAAFRLKWKLARAKYPGIQWRIVR